MVIRKDIMLKIFFIFIAILFCTANYTFAATPTGVQKSDNVSIMYKKPSHDQMRKQFEQRLNLTDKQKEKARQIHKQGHAEMRPVMMKIQMKRQEIETIRLTKLPEREMTERIDKLNNEISNLEKQAREKLEEIHQAVIDLDFAHAASLCRKQLRTEYPKKFADAFEKMDGLLGEMDIDGIDALIASLE